MECRLSLCPFIKHNGYRLLHSSNCCSNSHLLSTYLSIYYQPTYQHTCRPIYQTVCLLVYLLLYGAYKCIYSLISPARRGKPILTTNTQKSLCNIEPFVGISFLLSVLSFLLLLLLLLLPPLMVVI